MLGIEKMDNVRRFSVCYMILRQGKSMHIDALTYEPITAIEKHQNFLLILVKYIEN